MIFSAGLNTAEWGDLHVVDQTNPPLSGGGKEVFLQAADVPTCEGASILGGAPRYRVSSCD
jgi:hypothetical protein